MRKNYINKYVWVIALVFVVLTACKQEKKNQMHEDPYALEIDSGLAVLLKPTNQEIVSTIPTVKAQSGIQLFSVEVPGHINYDSRNETSIASRVSGRIERLYIKYNYQPISKGDLIMEIYSPDLVAAQRELLLISKSRDDEKMLMRAKQRLSLLGMSSTQIERIIRSGEVNYRVPVYSNASGYILEKNISSLTNNSMVDDRGASPVLLREGQYVNAGQSLFSIYRKDDLIAEFSLEPELLPHVKKGTSLLIQLRTSKEVFREKIGLIEPRLKAGEDFVSARVYLNSPTLLPGQMVNAHIPVMINNGWWLPKEAVWKSGIESIVFKKEKNVFVPKVVKTGITIDGKIQVVEDITSWEIASKAFYLVDSESFIRPQNAN